MPQNEDLLHRPIWWLEKINNSVYLRAKLEVEAIKQEYDTVLRHRLDIWHLCSEQTDRVSWSGSRLPRAKTLFTKSDPPPIKVQLFPVSEVMQSKIEEAYSHAPIQAWTAEQACLTLNGLFERTRTELPEQVPERLDLQTARRLIRKYYCLVELVALPGCDPYELAANVLIQTVANPQRAGKTQALQHTLPIYHKLKPLHADAITLDEEVEKADKATTEATIRAQTEARQRHQEILKHLVFWFEYRKITVQYNRYVDLSVFLKDRALLFEVKSTSYDNFHVQLRSAIGQLLEYRFRDRQFFDRSPNYSYHLVLVIEKSSVQSDLEFARQFCAELGILVVFWDHKSRSFEGFERTVQPLL